MHHILFFYLLLEVLLPNDPSYPNAGMLVAQSESIISEFAGSWAVGWSVIIPYKNNTSMLLLEPISYLKCHFHMNPHIGPFWLVS